MIMIAIVLGQLLSCIFQQFSKKSHAISSQEATNTVMIAVYCRKTMLLPFPFYFFSRCKSPITMWLVFVKPKKKMKIEKWKNRERNGIFDTFSIHLFIEVVFISLARQKVHFVLKLFGTSGIEGIRKNSNRFNRIKNGFVCL